jgi:hypothetical protein
VAAITEHESEGNVGEAAGEMIQRLVSSEIANARFGIMFPLCLW